MSEIAQSDSRPKPLVVSPPKILTALNAAAAITLFFLSIYLDASPSNSSFAAIYGKFIDEYLYNIVFGIFFLFSIVSLLDLKTYLVYPDEISPTDILIQRIIFPGKMRKIKISEIDEILPSRSPRFISAAYRSYNFKLKDGSKFSMPYDYINSQRVIAFLRSSIAAGKR